MGSLRPRSLLLQGHQPPRRGRSGLHAGGQSSTCRGRTRARTSTSTSRRVNQHQYTQRECLTGPAGVKAFERWQVEVRERKRADCAAACTYELTDGTPHPTRSVPSSTPNNPATPQPTPSFSSQLVPIPPFLFCKPEPSRPSDDKEYTLKYTVFCMLSDVDLVWIHPMLFIIFFCLYPNHCLFSPICVLNKAVNPL